MISDGEPPISVRRRAICHRRTDYALRSELRRCKRRDIASGSRRPGVRDLVAQESHRQHSAVPMYLTAARAGGFGVSFPPRNTDPAPGPGKPIVRAPKARDPTGMALGTVKFFKPDKGYGAITSPELPDGFDAGPLQRDRDGRLPLSGRRGPGRVRLKSSPARQFPLRRHPGPQALTSTHDTSAVSTVGGR